MEDLPEVADALGAGELCWSVAREVTRVATEETESEWLEAAKGKTARQVEELVAGHREGEKPSDPKDENLRKHVLRFEVEGDTKALLREVMAMARREAGESLSDDEALRIIARKFLAGPSDEGRASYQVSLTVCEECGRAHQQGDGELIPVGPEVVEMAECDCQEIGRTQVGAPTRASKEISPATRRQVSSSVGAHTKKQPASMAAESTNPSL